MNLLLRRILTLIEAGVPATAAATATALTTVGANVVLILARFTGLVKVYPTLAASVTVTASATAWTLGSFVEIVPASTITSAYIVTGVNIDVGTMITGEYGELVLYQGASDTEFARVKIQAVKYGFVPLSGAVIAANAKIRAKLTVSSNNARTASISLSYI
jgi:hypothetical protein